MGSYFGVHAVQLFYANFVRRHEKVPEHGVYAMFRDFPFGAVDEIRTRDLILTKDVLCLLSYNSKQKKPTAMPPVFFAVATRMGLEPTASSVTG